ncbi:MAG: hypothetical protein ACLPY5_02915, partial [Candidatus Bathyarchaeia archaeon]
MNDGFLIALRLVAESDNKSQEKSNLDTVKLLINAKHCVEQRFCTLCQFVGVPFVTSSPLQQHHIAGKVYGQPNFYDTITVCDQCHSFLTDYQRAWLINRKAPPLRLSSYFFGWANIFDLLYYMSEISLFENLARRFRAKGYDVRNVQQRRHD